MSLVFYSLTVLRVYLSFWLITTASSTFFAPSVNKLSVFDQQVLVFFDAGTTPSVSAAADGANFLPAVVTQVMTLTGYMLDCNASPCAPIAP